LSCKRRNKIAPQIQKIGKMQTQETGQTAENVSGNLRQSCIAITKTDHRSFCSPPEVSSLMMILYDMPIKG
jgi:hypothetical protein